MAIGIPGALKGYSTIYNLYGGGVSWESLFEPTIQFCEEGMEVSLALAASLNHFQDLIKDDPLFRYYTTYVFFKYLFENIILILISFKFNENST